MTDQEKIEKMSKSLQHIIKLLSESRAYTPEGYACYEANKVLRECGLEKVV